MKQQFILLFWVAVVCVAAVPLVGNLDPAFAEEDGFLENLQAGMLLCSCIVFLLNARGMERGFKGFFIANALLCVNVLLREVDVEDHTTVRWIVLAGSGAGRNTILFALWSILFFRYRTSVLPMLRRWRSIAGSACGIIMVGGGLALLCGDVFEKRFYRGANAHVFEEFLETVGYFLVLLAALGVHWSIKQKRHAWCGGQAASCGMGGGLGVEPQPSGKE